MEIILNYKILFFFGILTTSIVQGIDMQAVVTDRAPQAVGPYSQAVMAGSFLFISGQIAIDPLKGELIGNTIEAQTEQVLKNIEGILTSQGLAFENVVKTEVYLKNMQDFKGMNRVYAKSFSSALKPARQAVQVAKLYQNALVEISCIAYIPSRENL